MHRGIARGYQFSAAEIDWLIKEGILTYANKDTKTGDVTVDLHGDVLAAAIQNRVKGQNLKIGAAQGYDWITRLMSQPGQVGAHHSVRGAS